MADELVRRSKPLEIPEDLKHDYEFAKIGGGIVSWRTIELIERLSRSEQELQMVDEALARRPAVAESPNRYTAICSAFEMASRAQKAEAIEKHWKFHYEKNEAELTTLREALSAAQNKIEKMTRPVSDEWRSVSINPPNEDEWVILSDPHPEPSYSSRTSMQSVAAHDESGWYVMQNGRRIGFTPPKQAMWKPWEWPTLLASRSHDQPATPEEASKPSRCEVELGRIMLLLETCVSIDDLRAKVYGAKPV